MTDMESFYSLSTPSLIRAATTTMEHLGFKASIMRAERLADTGSPHCLPPGVPIPVFPVDCLPGCPKEWIKEGGFVCPVDTDWGIWFDWRENDSMNTAVVPSVKGMNPITGMKMTGPHLESYEKCCPVHGTPFVNGLFCKECGYEWTPQNYITFDSGAMWWDGFRQPNGSVRQFFFTDDDRRDIASIVIGRDNVVPAFGFVFFESILPRYNTSFSKVWITGGNVIFSPSVDIHDEFYEKGSGSDDADAYVYSVCYSTHDNPSLQDQHSAFRSLKSAHVSVGAGAEIQQTLAKDSLGLSGWKPTPSSVIRLYFCFKEQFESIVSEGVCDSKRESGFLCNLPIG
jgi:hypothetical protein